jgi:hypothetical protein
MTLRLSEFSICALGAFLISCCLSTPGRADWQLLPESRHHLVQTHALFIEHHNIVSYRGAGRYWAAAGATLPILGDNASPYHPQLLFHLSANDSMHVNDGGGVFTETLDTRIGIYLEAGLPWWELRVSASTAHTSGHVVDGTDDPSLSPLNLGDNYFQFKVLRDWGDQLRVGLQFTPVFHAIPDELPHTLSEFVEVFPLGASETPGRFSPYVALGLIHPVKFSSVQTVHIQLGVSSGSHFTLPHTHGFRLALGYYNGVDPRAKYSQYEGKRGSFAYLAAMFDL